MQARELIEQVYICLCRQNALYGEWARASGISYHTIMTLYAIDQMGPCTQRRIAAEWSLSKQTVNTVVKDLESRGYVRFTAGRDRKEKLVAFTPAGREYAGGCLRDLYQAEERAMEQVDPALCLAMVDGMRAYTEAFTREVRHGAQS